MLRGVVEIESASDPPAGGLKREHGEGVGSCHIIDVHIARA